MKLAITVEYPERGEKCHLETWPEMPYVGTVALLSVEYDGQQIDIHLDCDGAAEIGRVLVGVAEMAQQMQE